MKLSFYQIAAWLSVWQIAVVLHDIYISAPPSSMQYFQNMFPIFKCRKNKYLSSNRNPHKKEIASVCLKVDVRVLQQDKDRRSFLEYIRKDVWKTCTLIKYEIQGSYYIKVRNG